MLVRRIYKQTARGYVTNSWRYGTSLKSCHCRCAPYFGGDGKMLQKIWGCPHLASHCDEMAQHR